MSKRIPRTKPAFRGTRERSIEPGQGWRENAALAGWFALPVIFLLLLLFTGTKIQWNKSIDDRLRQWREAYHLDEATVERLRQMEFEFHGSGNPLTSPIEHTPEEVTIHHRQMADLMAPEDAKRFLHDLRTGRRKH